MEELPSRDEATSSNRDVARRPVTTGPVGLDRACHDVDEDVYGGPRAGPSSSTHSLVNLARECVWAEWGRMKAFEKGQLNLTPKACRAQAKALKTMQESVQLEKSCVLLSLLAHLTRDEDVTLASLVVDEAKTAFVPSTTMQYINRVADAASAHVVYLRLVVVPCSSPPVLKLERLQGTEHGKGRDRHWNFLFCSSLVLGSNGLIPGIHLLPLGSPDYKARVVTGSHPSCPVPHAATIEEIDDSSEEGVATPDPSIPSAPREHPDAQLVRDLFGSAVSPTPSEGGSDITTVASEVESELQPTTESECRSNEPAAGAYDNMQLVVYVGPRYREPGLYEPVTATLRTSASSRPGAGLGRAVLAWKRGGEPWLQFCAQAYGPRIAAMERRAEGYQGAATHLWLRRMRLANLINLFNYDCPDRKSVV